MTELGFLIGISPILIGFMMLLIYIYCEFYRPKYRKFRIKNEDGTYEDIEININE
jgi:hypothetical protein